MSDLWSTIGSTVNNPNSVASPLYGGLNNTQGAASSYSLNQPSAITQTNVISFNPANNTNFQFQATLDGAIYNVIVNWNVYGQRYYVNIYDVNNSLIVCLPSVGSPLGYDISLTAGYFVSKLVYRTSMNQFEISP